MWKKLNPYMHAFLETLDRRLTQNKFFCQVGKVTKTVSQIRT